MSFSSPKWKAKVEGLFVFLKFSTEIVIKEKKISKHKLAEPKKNPFFQTAWMSYTMCQFSW